MKNINIKYTVVPKYQVNRDKVEYTLAGDIPVYEINYDVVEYYYVLKCYIVKEVKNGYQVILPFYNQFDTYFNSVRRDIDSLTTNDIEVVEEVFGNFNQALEYAKMKNNVLLSNELRKNDIDNNILNALNQYSFEMSEEVDAETMDMKITKEEIKRVKKYQIFKKCTNVRK